MASLALNELELTDNAGEKRYELKVGNETALLEYIKTTDKIYLVHTEVPRSLEGKGVGSALVRKVLAEVERSGLQLFPICPFVTAYISRHPEYRKLLEKNVRIPDKPD